MHEVSRLQWITQTIQYFQYEQLICEIAVHADTYIFIHWVNQKYDDQRRNMALRWHAMSATTAVYSTNTMDFAFPETCIFQKFGISREFKP